MKRYTRNNMRGESKGWLNMCANVRKQKAAPVSAQSTLTKHIYTVSRITAENRKL